MTETPWHRYSLAETMSALDTNANGLTAAEARGRLARYGRNELRTSPPRPWWRLLLKQFADFMILLLLGAAVLSSFIGDVIDAIVIGALVLLNATMSMIQEFRAERALHAPNESILARGLGLQVLWMGLSMAGLILAGQAWALDAGSANWQTLVFTSLCFAQLTYVLAIRSEKQSLFKLGLTTNRPLLGTVVLTVMLQLLIVYMPALQMLFKTSPLSVTELSLAVAIAFVVFAIAEVQKLLVRRRVPVRSECKAATA